MTNRYGEDAANPFDGERPSVAEIDAAIYGGEPVELPAADVPISGRVVAEAIDIMDIWPDMKQPRRTIPVQVRGEWDGNPATIGEVFDKWASMAFESGRNFDLLILLLGGDDGTAYEISGDLIYDGLMELAALAANIQEAGLLHPITIYRQGDRYVIETGERRWMAYHLLTHYLDAVWHKRIPARVQERFSVWRQAAENGARATLNAIGRARQLALLLMDMHDDAYFDRYETLVLPGECDRIFYTQVADGQQFSVRRGMSQKVLDAMGLKSVRQISHYRALLSIPDEIWELADAENWSEFSIRSYMDDLQRQQQMERSILPPPPPQRTEFAPRSDPEEAPPEPIEPGVSGTTVPLTDGYKPDGNDLGEVDTVDEGASEVVGQGAIEITDRDTLQYCYHHLRLCGGVFNLEIEKSLYELSLLSHQKIERLMADPEVDWNEYLRDLDNGFLTLIDWIWGMHQAFMEQIRSNDGS